MAGAAQQALKAESTSFEPKTWVGLAARWFSGKAVFAAASKSCGGLMECLFSIRLNLLPGTGLLNRVMDRHPTGPGRHRPGGIAIEPARTPWLHFILPAGKTIRTIIKHEHHFSNHCTSPGTASIPSLLIAPRYAAFSLSENCIDRSLNQQARKQRFSIYSDPRCKP